MLKVLENETYIRLLTVGDLNQLQVVWVAAQQANASKKVKVSIRWSLILSILLNSEFALMLCCVVSEGFKSNSISLSLSNVALMSLMQSMGFQEVEFE